MADEVERRRKRLLNAARKAESREQTRPEKQLQPEEKALRYDDPASAAAEEGLVRLLYLEPALASRPGLPPAEAFSAPALARIYTVLLDKARRGESIGTATLGAVLSADEMSLLVRLLQKPEQLSRGETALNDYVTRIRERSRLQEENKDLRALAQKLREKKGYEG